MTAWAASGTHASTSLRNASEALFGRRIVIAAPPAVREESVVSSAQAVCVSKQVNTQTKTIRDWASLEIFMEAPPRLPLKRLVEGAAQNQVKDLQPFITDTEENTVTMADANQREAV